MKKILSFIFLIALVVLPLNVNAESKLEWKTSKDASGVTTVEIYMTIGNGTTYEKFDANIVGQHALIQGISGTDEFVMDQTSAVDANKTSAHIITSYVNGYYVGNDNQVLVAKFTYIKDASYTGDEPTKVFITPQGGTEVTITEKQEKNVQTGSALPYVGIACGLLLIGAAYIISRKSTKLYRM